MTFLLSNRALLRGMLAGAVVLTGTGACSRSDRTESGSDTSAAALPDSSNYSPQSSGTDTATGAMSDTVATPAQSSQSTQPRSPARSNTPRAETAPPSDNDAAGYRSMERDTTNVANQPDSAAAEVSAAAADTAAITEGGADSTALGYAEMARDTSTVADQADTAAAPNGEVALEAAIDTSSQTDTTVSAEADVVVADISDTSANAGRIRPPEDSTEILGNVTTTDEVADDTADEQVIRPEDRETVAASETPSDEVGAAAIEGNVTGADAIALMSREGVRCAVSDPEENEAVRWDMSNTPVTLNPCGMGSMVLSRIWTRVE